MSRGHPVTTFHPAIRRCVWDTGLNRGQSPSLLHRQQCDGEITGKSAGESKPIQATVTCVYDDSARDYGLRAFRLYRIVHHRTHMRPHICMTYSRPLKPSPAHLPAAHLAWQSYPVTFPSAQPLMSSFLGDRCSALRAQRPD